MFGLTTGEKLKNIQESQAETLGIVLEMNAKTDAEKKAAKKIIARGKASKRDIKKVSKLEKKKIKQDRKNAKEAAKTKKRLAKLTTKQEKAKDKVLENKSKEVSTKINEAKETVGDTSGNAKGESKGIKKGLGKFFSKIGSGLSKALKPKSLQDIKDKAESVASLGTSNPSEDIDNETGEAISEANQVQTAEVVEKVNEANAANLKATTAINSLTQSKLNLIREDTEDIKATVMEQAAEDADKKDQKKMLEKFDDDLNNINDATDTLVQNDIDDKDAGQKRDKDLIKRLNQLHSNLLEKVEEKATTFYKIWYGIQLFFSRDFWELLGRGLQGMFDKLIEKIKDLFNFFNPNKKVDTTELYNKAMDASGKYTNKERVSAYEDALKYDVKNLSNKYLEEFDKTYTKEQVNAMTDDELEAARKAIQDKVGLTEALRKQEEFERNKKLGKVDVSQFGKSQSEIDEENRKHREAIDDFIDKLKSDMGKGKVPSIYDIYAAEDSPFYDYISRLTNKDKNDLDVPINGDEKKIKKALKLLYDLVDNSNQGKFVEDAYRVAPNKYIKSWFMDKLLEYDAKDKANISEMNPAFEDEVQFIPFDDFMQGAETDKNGVRKDYLKKKKSKDKKATSDVSIEDYEVATVETPSYATKTTPTESLKDEANKTTETTTTTPTENKKEVVEKETHTVEEPIVIGVTEAKADSVDFGEGY